MEPLNDEELKRALETWKAPRAPASLERRVLPREIWWRWLFTGSVRVPVPVLLLVAAGAVVVYAGMRENTAQAPKATVSLADFRPVENVQPQIIRRGHEGN